MAMNKSLLVLVLRYIIDFTVYYYLYELLFNFF